MELRRLVPAPTPGDGQVDPHGPPHPEELARAADLAADATLLVDSRGVIRHANAAAEELLGRPGAQLRGRVVTSLVSPSSSEAVAAAFERQVVDPQHADLGNGLIRVVLPSGGELPVDVTVRPMVTTRGWRAVLALRDGTRRQRALDAVATRERVLAAIAEAVDELLGNDDLDEAIDASLRALGEATEVSRVYVFEVTDAGEDHLARQRWEWASPGVEPQIDNPDLQAMPLVGSGFARWRDVLSAGGALYGDVGDFPDDEAEFLAMQDIQSIVVVPLIDDGDWWGFLGFDECTRERHWTTPEIDALRAAAHILVVTMRQHAIRRTLELSEQTYAAAYAREVEASDRLRQLDSMKDSFIEAVSHELRTPLAGVVGFAETLERLDAVQDDAMARTLAERMRDNARRLSVLVTDLLDLGTLTREATEPLRQLVNVDAVVRAALADVELVLRGRDLTVDVHADRAEVDPRALARIIETLLHNVARHTPAGTAAQVRLWCDGQDLQIAVEDDGPGIPEDSREEVFQPFVQGPDVPRHSPGTGVGLSVVSRLALVHGGRAWIESSDTGGARVRVTLAAAVEQLGQ